MLKNYEDVGEWEEDFQFKNKIFAKNGNSSNLWRRRRKELITGKYNRRKRVQDRKRMTQLGEEKLEFRINKWNVPEKWFLRFIIFSNISILLN